VQLIPYLVRSDYVFCNDTRLINNQYRQARQTKQNKTKQNKTKQNKTKQNKTLGQTSIPTRQTTINSQQAKRNADD
jgi:hypothetical protein